jgi:hypothetical protein
LFLLALLRRKVDGSAELLDAGDIHQDDYPAFLPRRAAAEELGDVLGEGLMSLAQVGRPNEAHSPTFWRHALAHRREFRQRLEDWLSDGRHDMGRDMLGALAAIRRVQRRVAQNEAYWVAQFIAYTQQWEKDLKTWGRRLHPDDLPRPERLLGSREVDAGTCYGRFDHPQQFVRELAGENATSARQASLTPV